MKLHFLAAGALLLGTSALAQDGVMPAPVKDSVLTSDDAAWAAAAAAKLEPASAVAWDQQTSTQLPGDTPDAVDTSQGDPDLDLADAPPVDETSQYQGVGGPIESADAGTLDLTPRPATANYPACQPGPGDDNCIQLYEPGVQTALASWSGPTGGVQTAMADTSEGSEVLAADADTAVQTAAAEPVATPADMSQYQGTGGPETDVETGYPACSATVTDRCIQLYERGVTGEGN
jgi:hypothetical protein